MDGNTGYQKLVGCSSGSGEVIVGPQFCAAHTVELVLTKKALSLSDGDYNVTDVNGNLVYKLRGISFNIKGRIVLRNADGIPLVSVQAKPFSRHERWMAFKGESSESNDLLFSAKRTSILQMKATLDVFLASNTNEKFCDFKLKDVYSQLSCTIYNGDSSVIIAKAKDETNVKNRLLGKDKFRITVDPHVDQAFVLSLIIILIQMNKVLVIPAAAVPV